MSATGSGTVTPLRIAAASDLQLALPRLIDRFQAQTGTASMPVFLASGKLAEQIKQGAPFDVFMAANESFVRELADGGFVRPESVHAYALDPWSWRCIVSLVTRFARWTI